MAYKEFQLDDVGAVTIYKRRGSQSIRLTVGGDGRVKVTIPAWAPYASGVSFAKARQDWILEHRPATATLLREGQPVGKAHRLHFMADATVRAASSRIQGSQITISYPAYERPEDVAVQAAAHKACIRALRSEAAKLLLIRLNELAANFGYDYRSLTIKHLKGRWGSCDQDKNIVLNLFLMQLPWELIDYVILHELAHTRVMQHGTMFWAEMERHTPHAKQLRKQIHTHQPLLKA